MAKRIREEDLVLNMIVNGDKGKKEILELDRKIRDHRIELEKLEAQEKSLRAEGKKDTDQYKKVTLAIEEKNQAIYLAENRLKDLRKGLSLTRMTYNDLRQEISRLSKLKNAATPGSKQWHALDAQLQKVRARFNEVRGSADKAGFSMKNLASRFNHYFGIVTAGLATLTSVLFGIKKAITEFAEFDDKLSDVQKTSGLTKGVVKELNAELEELDSRTAQENLLGLARIGGKLGKDTKEELLQFVGAVDQINVALSEDLGGNVEETINIVGKLVDIFDLEREFGLERSLLKAGSLINSLGAASTANEGAIVDFISRTSGLAKTFDVSITQIAGLGSVVDQLNLSIETAGTAYNQIVPQMFSDTATFARIAGVPVKEFSELLETDLNEAFLKVLEGVKGNDSSMAALVERLGDLGVDGARVTNIITSLANNTGKLRKEQDLAAESFKEGTSITDEFNVKNTNAAAVLEKARKGLAKMTRDLGEKLMPVMTVSTNSFSYLIKLLTISVDFFMKNGKQIIILTSIFVAYGVALKVVNFRIAESTVLIKARVFWDKALRASTLLVAAAQAIFTGNTLRAAAAMRAFNTVTKLNPLLLLISLLAAGAVALALYSKGLTAAEKAQKSLIDVETEAQKSIIDQKMALEEKLAIARDETKSLNQRKQAIKDLNELSPDYLEGLTLETINTEKAKVATDKYIESLLKKARVEAAQNKLRQLAEREIELENQGNEASLSFGQKARVMLYEVVKQGTGFGPGGSTAGAKLISQNYASVREQIATERQSLIDFIQENQVPFDSIIDGSDDNLSPEELAKRYREIVTQIEKGALLIKNRLEKQLADGEITKTEFQKQMKEYAEAFKIAQEEADKLIKPKPLTQAEITARYNGVLKALELGQQQITQTLRDQLLAREITEKEFKERLKEYELAMLIAKREAMLQAGLDITEIQGEINDAEFEAELLHLQRIMSIEEAETQFMKDQFDQRQANFNKFREEKTKADAEDIKAWHAKRVAEEAAAIATADARRSEAEATVKSLAQSGAAAVENANTMQEAGVAIINIIRDQIKARIAESIAEAAAKALSKVPFPFNIALAAAAGGAVSLLFSKLIPPVKSKTPETVSGAETGGYMVDVQRAQDGKRFRAENRPSARGFLKRTSLLVSENGEEFVANNSAVRNPSVRSFLNIIDQAQRNGSINSLNLNKILQRQVFARGLEAGGFVSNATASQTVIDPNTVPNTDPEVIALLQRNYQIMSLLMARLQQPLEASVSLQKIKKANDEFEQAKGPGL